MTDKSYKTRRGFNTSGRDYSAGEAFPAEGHEIPEADLEVLVARKMIAEASSPQQSRAAPDDSLRQENEALKARVAELEAQRTHDPVAAEEEPVTWAGDPPRRRGRPPKVRTEEIGNADEE